MVLSPETVNKLVARAYRLLAKREYSAHELVQRFSRQASRGDCEEMLRKLIEQGAQSDQRFAEMLCRSRYGAGRGPERLRYELRNHRIDEQLITEAMSPYEDEWKVLAEQVRLKKFGSPLPADAAGRAKQLRFLRQRGFGSEELSQYFNPVS